MYVKAPFKAIGREITVKVPTGETKKSLFGEKQVMEKRTQWEQTGRSDCEIDGELFSQKIVEVVDELNRGGCEIAAVLPIISGKYNYHFQAEGIRSETRLLRETEKVRGCKFWLWIWL